MKFTKEEIDYLLSATAHYRKGAVVEIYSAEFYADVVGKLLFMKYSVDLPDD